MFKDIFKDYSESIRFYIGAETITDPFKKTVEFSDLKSYPVKAIVTSLNFSQVQWKIPGITTEKAKQIVIHKKDLSLLKQSYKIKIENETYNGWRVNGQLQYRQEGNYIRAYVYLKKETE